MPLQMTTYKCTLNKGTMNMTLIRGGASCTSTDQLYCTCVGQTDRPFFFLVCDRLAVKTKQQQQLRTLLLILALRS